jgi:restriction endonuclease
VLGCEGFGPKEEKVKEGKKFFLPFSKELTKLEFKHKFEFKQIKTMQQHVCNSKLL